MRKSFIAVLLLISCLAPAQAAVTIDGTCDGATFGASPESHAGHTVGAGLTGGILVAAVIVGSNTAVSAVAVNWDSGGTPQAMTSLVSVNSGTAQVYLFGLRNPTAGNKTITATWTGGGTALIHVCSFQGADVTNDGTSFPVASRVSATNLAPISVAVSSATGNIVWAGFSSVANFTSTSGVIGAGGCTGSCDNTGAQWATAYDYWNTTGASTTVSASPGSGTTSAVGAFEIAQTGGGATVTPRMQLLGVGP